MAERRRRRPDLDERFSLHPQGEGVLRKLLDDEETEPEEDENA